MGESIGIDSVLGGWTMPTAYSGDMRKRVIAEVESGASRREAAEEFEISPSTAIIWVKCYRKTGRCAAKPRGGSVSPLERSEEHTSELQSLRHLVCRLLLEKKKKTNTK